MSKSTLTVRELSGEFTVVAHVGTPGEFVAARRIREEFIARQFSAAPELIDAAVFAASAIKAGGMFDLSEKLAFQKLETALEIAGIKVDTIAIREYDAHKAAAGVVNAEAKAES